MRRTCWCEGKGDKLTDRNERKVLTWRVMDWAVEIKCSDGSDDVLATAVGTGGALLNEEVAARK